MLKSLLRIASLVLSVLILGDLPGAACAAAPNVVMIMADDMGWTDYGFMGHKAIQTPHLDRLASQSLTFTRGYVPDSLCRPSLMTFISGLYPHQHGVVGNDPPVPPELLKQGKGKLYQHPDYMAVREAYLGHVDRAPKLAEMLGRKGYVSFQSGKWWEGNFSRGGFTRGMTHGDFTRGGRHGDEGLKIGREGMQPVFDFLDSVRGENKPFYLYYAPMLPHTPFTAPQRLVDKYKEKTPHMPVARYWAMCEWFDESVGQLLDYLDKHQLADNTVVIYVTDNGWEQLVDQDGGGSGGARAKRSQYDLGVRTPIMIRWPGHIKPKMDREHLVSSIDLAPTVLSVAGLESTSEMQGINLLDSQSVVARRAVFGEIFDHDIQHMTDPVASLRFRWVIEGDWKLIVPHRQLEPNAPLELYNVSLDPHEHTNLAKTEVVRVEHLQKLLDGWWNPEKK